MSEPLHVKGDSQSSLYTSPLSIDPRACRLRRGTLSAGYGGLSSAGPARTAGTGR